MDQNTSRRHFLEVKVLSKHKTRNDNKDNVLSAGIKETREQVKDTFTEGTIDEKVMQKESHKEE